MLTFLSIRNFTLIESMDLEVKPKLSVITGETGAGKSIIIGALELLMGKRANTDAVRRGAQQADILAIFDITTNYSLQKWLAEKALLDTPINDQGEAELPEEGCLVRRVITQEGRSRSYINGRLVTLAEMKQVGDKLLSIHGQHQNQMLLKKEYQLTLLDQFADTTHQQQQLQKHYQQYLSLKKKIENHLDQNEQVKAKRELLEYQIKELEALSLANGEYEALEQQHHQLANAEQLTEICQRTHEILSSTHTGNLVDPLQRAITDLSPYTQKDPALNNIFDMLNSANILLNEAASALSQYIESIEFNQAQLLELESRLSDIHQVARKHNITANDLPNVLEALSQELSQLGADDKQQAELQREADALAEQMQEIASQLSLARKAAIPKLETAVTSQIKQLGLPNADFKIVLTPIDKEITPNGHEQIEFMISTNPGQPEGPLRKVASGGELSRVSLAIQVICSTKELLPPTMIFDEVDVGVGGAVAESVGRLLRQLGEQGQVMCVTHLPQVASQGHNHIHVNKIHQEQCTFIEIAPLSMEEKISEIARMLGGIEISESTITHAKEMINQSLEPAV